MLLWLGFALGTEITPPRVISAGLKPLYQFYAPCSTTLECLTISTPLAAKLWMESTPQLPDIGGNVESTDEERPALRAKSTIFRTLTYIYY
ncbi:hypothetical protein T265_11961 [Opisthorchis viverrini]|uniref:Uncharacterized protein n=1 Tax=Opisthorchis viverrini TaxID=6198 RepID=A0A074Z7K5_OPIVI|nr:hypothetical protein T265_11961 [Opisthorchis viverrini]KER19180.1 hypothetical protein T265_11961 [Opisthorchis viverrini]